MSPRAIAEKLEYAQSAHPWKPHAYQKKAVRFLLEHAAAGLFLDPGLGKTSITLAAIKILLKERMLHRALIIAPLRVCSSVWPVERDLWTDFHGLKMEVLHGKYKEENLRRKADIYVINPDGMPWLCSNGLIAQLKPDTLIIDESTLFKHTRTQRFKLIKPLLKNFRRRWILTGTPVPNGYLDLFGQMYILDMGHSLGHFITHYRQDYFFPTGFGGYTWKLKPESEEAIQKRIAPLTLRLDAEDYVDMPEVIENIIRVDLPARARKAYNDLEDEMLTVLDDSTVVTAVSVAASSIKCRQVANGGLYHNPDPAQWDATPTRKNESYTSQLKQFHTQQRSWTNLHTAKVDAVVDLVDELGGQPVIVCYDFEHDRDRLLAALGRKTPYIGGGTSPKETQAIVEKWNRGEIPVLLGHPAAMGHGLNLQHAGNHIIWHSLTYNYETYDQTVRRIRRQGSKHAAVYVHHIVARDTVDEAVLRALRAKRKGQDALLTALKEYAKTRVRR